MMRGWMLSMISILSKLILYRPEHNPMKPWPEPKPAQDVQARLVYS
jgi:hypothetical protein